MNFTRRPTHHTIAEARRSPIYAWLTNPTPRPPAAEHADDEDTDDD